MKRRALPTDCICYDPWPGPSVTVTIVSGYSLRLTPGDTYFYTNNGVFQYGVVSTTEHIKMILKGRAWNDWITGPDQHITGGTGKIPLSDKP